VVAATGHDRARANRRGILWMCAAMAFFIVNDALVKHVSERVPARSATPVCSGR